MLLRTIVGLTIATLFVLHLNFVNPKTEDCGFICYSWIAILFAIVDAMLSSYLFYSKKELFIYPAMFAASIFLPFAAGTTWSVFFN